MELSKKELEEIIAALSASTHDINDYNCDDWPIGQGCNGCKGDELREQMIAVLEEKIKSHEKE